MAEFPIGASQSRTANWDSGDLSNYRDRGLYVIVDITTIGTGSITVTIEGKDPASAKYWTILASAAMVANATNVLSVNPGATPAANQAVSVVLPRTYRVRITHNNANPATYSVGAVTTT